MSGPVGDPLLTVFWLKTVLIKSSKLCWQCATASTLNTAIITFCMFANWKQMNENTSINLFLFVYRDEIAALLLKPVVFGQNASQLNITA